MCSLSLMPPFSYDLPVERIAQRPVAPYDAAKLLVIDRCGGKIQDLGYRSLPALLRPEDLLVFNDTKVIPARLLGHTVKTGAKIEVLLLRPISSSVWAALGKPLKRLKLGTEVRLGGSITGVVGERVSEDQFQITLSAAQGESISAAIDREGLMPVPPYIRGGLSDAQDKVDYQTFFARAEGSIAAPTASLHFTPELLSSIQSAGMEILYATLHVGLSSIRPLWREGQPGPEDPAPGPERYHFDPKVLARCRAAKERGGRVVAVGTTMVRALESMVREEGRRDEGELDASLFITPGFEFRVVDALITNFHQPGTTHLLLVEAFLGARDLLAQSYAHALEGGYRFLSYGDGMLMV